MYKRQELKERLDEGCIAFGKEESTETLEELAMTDEKVLDYFMEHFLPAFALTLDELSQ